MIQIVRQNVVKIKKKRKEKKTIKKNKNNNLKLEGNSIPWSMNGESCGYDLCVRHSNFLNDIPPK